MPHADEIYAVADELRSIANMGLHYAVNDFDAERYRKVLTASARLVAALEQRQVDEVLGCVDIFIVAILAHRRN